MGIETGAAQTGKARSVVAGWQPMGTGWWSPEVTASRSVTKYPYVHQTWQNYTQFSVPRFASSLNLPFLFFTILILDKGEMNTWISTLVSQPD